MNDVFPRTKRALFFLSHIFIVLVLTLRKLNELDVTAKICQRESITRAWKTKLAVASRWRDKYRGLALTHTMSLAWPTLVDSFLDTRRVTENHDYGFSYLYILIMTLLQLL